jgi:hypothetical protein
MRFPRRWLLRCTAVLLAAGALAAQAAPQHAEYLQTFTWPLQTGMGGYSALLVSPDGTRFTAFSDRGHRLDGVLVRQEGQITAVEDIGRTPVTGLRGSPLKGRRADAEGVTRLPDGQLALSFERQHRVLTYRDGVATGQLPLPDPARALPRNGGIEALATAPDGGLIAIAETARGDGFQLWRHDGGGWNAGPAVPRRGSLVPVGADVGPDGRLYLLERQFLGIGFRSRVRSFSVTAEGLGDEMVLFTSGLREHDNLEGLAVWRDGGGSIRLTMISDDNFAFTQQTEIVEYRVPSTLAPAADSG